MDNNDDNRPRGELLVYQGQGLESPVQVRLEGETVWLSQKLLAELYGVGVPTINEHIATIYDDEELLPEATIRKFRIVQTEGSRQVGRLIDHYNQAVKRNLVHFPASFRFQLTNQEIAHLRSQVVTSSGQGKQAHPAQRLHSERKARLAGIEPLDTVIHEI